MDLNEILTPQGVMSLVNVNSKKQLLQEVAERAATLANVDERIVFDVLLQRERLGSTGVGNGVAIPHGKLPGLEAIYGVFARLKQPIDFDSMDDQPVDIVFMLLAPEGSGADHLKALSRIARLLRNQATLSQLRATTDEDALYSIVMSTENLNDAMAG
ncbi:PTS IIA-like nitrogen regulatory protein PtsN [Pseudahrensia aquimaris]|uniref:PTS IIA-like nitrogen regulatory protein PtsN n=1 Tax=Pseudahrensia aquimaris TaxID=744461 RepID=A0ABW3FCM8_9HYPH